MDENFKLVTRGSIILRWSPSGALERYVVRKANVRIRLTIAGKDVPQTGALGHELVFLNDANELEMGREGDFLTEEGIESSEGFGYTYTYMLGEAYQLPDFL